MSTPAREVCFWCDGTYTPGHHCWTPPAPKPEPRQPEPKK